MNKKLGMLAVLVAISMFLLIPAGSAASRTLTEDTVLPIQGWTVGMEVRRKRPGDGGNAEGGHEAERGRGEGEALPEGDEGAVQR